MTKRRESRGPGLATVLAAMCVFVCAPNADAQAPASTTWSVSIVLPAKLVAGQPATLAVLGTDGRLAEGITVDLGEDQRVKTDSSGRVTFTVPLGLRFMIVNAQGTSAAALVDDLTPVPGATASASDARSGIKVPVMIAQRDQFAIWGGGSFAGDAREDHVTFGGDPAFVLAASPECLIVATSSRVIPGPAKILVSSPPQQWSADSVVIGLNFDPPRPALEPGKRSKLVLHAQGTSFPLRVLVENKTPGILQFEHGDAQQLTTSGGEQNAASIDVMAISTGDFSFNARLLREPDAETARRFLEAAALLAPAGQKSDVKKLADRLKKKPQESYKVWADARKMEMLTIAGDYRTLLEAATAALN